MGAGLWVSSVVSGFRVYGRDLVFRDPCTSPFLLYFVHYILADFMLHFIQSSVLVASLTVFVR